MNAASFERHGVQVVRRFARVPPVRGGQAQGAANPVNLMRNAKYAMDEADAAEKRLTMRCARGGGVAEVR